MLVLVLIFLSTGYAEKTFDLEAEGYIHIQANETIKSIEENPATAIGSATGAALGTLLIPIPVVGSVVGSVIGSSIGSMIENASDGESNSSSWFNNLFSGNESGDALKQADQQLIKNKQIVISKTLKYIDSC